MSLQSKKFNKCEHRFKITRFLWDGKTKEITSLDMDCEKCRVAMFINDPSIHYGDMPDEMIKVDTKQYGK